MKTTVTIHGKRWDIVSVNRSELTDYRRDEVKDGDCVVPIHPGHKLTRKERVIRICKSLGEEDLMETLLHESLHAMYPEKNEEWIQQSAKELKTILWKFGFRKEVF